MLVGTRYQAALAEKRACGYFERLKSGDQGRVQCDSHGTFDTLGTVRTRRSRSITRTQGPAADRAASQQGVRRTTHAQRSTRGICPHSHRKESSRQQVDKDRRTAEQRDELAPSYVEPCLTRSLPRSRLRVSSEGRQSGGDLCDALLQLALHSCFPRC